MVRFAAVEGGGTTWVAAICENAPDNIIDRETFPTKGNPEETLGEVRKWLSVRHFDAIGVGTFGPVDCDAASPRYGYITSTPKPGWKNTNVLGLLGIREFGKPFKFDTDVNAPALAEYFLHRDVGLKSCAYITIGTGIGVGLVIDGKTVHGLLHPEAGHIRVGREPGDDFAGTCPYHGDCVEGMCASGALALRRGVSPAALAGLGAEDPLWNTCAHYLAALCANLILIASPERIVIGGGIMQRKCLYKKIRVYIYFFLPQCSCSDKVCLTLMFPFTQELTMKQLNGYIQNDKLLTAEAMESYIGPSKWYACLICWLPFVSLRLTRTRTLILILCL
jgi:fructokinase